MIIKIKELEKYPEVIGIFAGGCVSRGEGSSFRARAHAHTNKKDPAYGWICFRSYKRAYTSKGTASRIAWHELAHILTNQGHTKAWRAKMRELKQPLPKRYQGK